MVIDLEKKFVKIIRLEHKIMAWWLWKNFYSSSSDDNNTWITGARHLKFQTESINISIHFNIVHPLVCEFQWSKLLKLPFKQFKLWCCIHLKWLHVSTGMLESSGWTICFNSLPTYILVCSDWDLSFCLNHSLVQIVQPQDDSMPGDTCSCLMLLNHN